MREEIEDKLENEASESVTSGTTMQVKALVKMYIWRDGKKGEEERYIAFCKWCEKRRKKSGWEAT